MINWDNTSLTKEDFNSFINAAIQFLKDMESKNAWDFFVNDMSIKDFCDRFILKAFELNNYKEYEKYNRKVQDILTIYNILLETDWSKEDKTLRDNKDKEIWKLVLDKIDSIVDSVF